MNRVSSALFCFVVVGIATLFEWFLPERHEDDEQISPRNPNH